MFVPRSAYQTSRIIRISGQATVDAAGRKNAAKL